MRAVPASLTLYDDFDTIVIRPASPTAADPVVCTSWDLGAPSIRITSSPRASTDGTDDGAGFTGERAVTFDLKIFGDNAGTPYWYAERLAGMAHPARRPTLSVMRPTVDTGGDAWTMSLRGTPFSISYGRRAAALLEMQLSFNAPLGYLESPLREYTSSPASTVTATGVELPLTLPFTLGTGSGSDPALSFWLDGTAPVAPVIAIYGPVTDPEVRNSFGDRFKFVGLTLLTGQFVVVDMDAGTVRLGGDPGQSVYYLVDFSVSTFWRMPPGDNTVTYVAFSGQMTVQFKERRVTI